MKILLILNDPPYGTERSYNGLRLAKALAGKQDNAGLSYAKVAYSRPLVHSCENTI